MAVRWVNSDATGANDGTSESDGWTDCQSAMVWIGTAGPGPHKIWCRGLNTTLVSILSAGTRGGGIVFEGYSVVPGDNGQFVVDGTGRNQAMDSQAGSVDAHYLFKNFTCQNATQNGFFTSNTDYLAFHQSIFQNNGRRGAQIDNNGAFVACLARGNGWGGLDGDANCLVSACAVDMAASTGGRDGISLNNGSVNNCLVRNLQNNDRGVVWLSTGGAVTNTTIEDDPATTGTVGIWANSSTYNHFLTANNVLVDLSTGIDAINNIGSQIHSHNHFDNCDVDYGPSIDPDAVEETTTGDSMFQDRDNGDFTPAPGSPLLQSGIDGSFPLTIPGA